MTKRLWVFIVAIVLMFSSRSFADVDYKMIPPLDIEYENSLMEMKKNQIIVKFRSTNTLLNKETVFEKYSLDKGVVSDLAYNTKVVDIGDNNKVEDLIQKLENEPSIEYVEKNQIYRMQTVPNDPYYNNLWHLKNINAEEAWGRIDKQSDEVLVAVIDSGIDYNHQDLVNRIAPGGYNFLYNDTSIYDYDGHGTFISGIIAAEYNNNYGITGLAGSSNIKILPIRVFDYVGSANTIDIINAIDYCISKNVDVINMSIGGELSSNAFEDAIQRAIDSNIIVVAAAGNYALEGNIILYPAAYDGVISVGATDRYNNKCDFSNYNRYVDLVAPGEKIYSTQPLNSFGVGSGTSFSAPMVAATAALLKSVDPKLSVNDITEILTETAKDLGNVGKDYYYGYGLLNMEESIKRVTRVDVTNVSLDKTSLTVDIAEQYINVSLKATVLPHNASDKMVLWKSSDSNVATVTNNGVIKPVSEGITTITVITNDGQFKASCNLEVIDSSAEWLIWESKYYVPVDKTWTIEFNKTLDKNEIKEENIYITDGNGNILPMFFYQANHNIDTKIYIIPIEEYNSGQRYTLWIKGLKASNGSLLRKNVKMKFTIQ